MDVSWNFDGSLSQLLLVSDYNKHTYSCKSMLTAGSTYGPQAPTAFSNGPSCIEIQGDWIADVLSDMRDKKLRKIDADPQAEAEWKELVNDLIKDTPRGSVDSWYNGSNIPGESSCLISHRFRNTC